MFGNLKGWIFSIPLVLATVLLLYFAGRPEQRSAPTGNLALALKSVKLGTAPESLVPLGTDTRDGGALLRTLIDRFRDNGMNIDFTSFTNKKTPAGAKKLEDFCDQFADAMSCSNFSSLFKPEDMVVYGNKPYTKELPAMGKGVSDIGVYYADPKKPIDAERGRKYLEAVYRLGTVLYNDRQVFKEYREGMDLLREAGFRLSYIEKDAAKKSQLQGFYKAVEEASLPQARIFETFRQITGDGSPVAEPGDTFDIALNSQEPMWQTEAILRLGRFKLGYAKYADQKAAPGVLDELSKRNDLKPNVKVAIERAKNITGGDFQKIDGF